MKLKPRWPWIINSLAILAFLIPFKQKIEIIQNSGHAEIHALIYLFLFGLFRLAKYSRIKTFLLLSLQGVAIEIIQPFTGRGFSYGDMLANTGGALLGLIIFYFIESRATNSTGPSRKTSEN